VTALAIDLPGGRRATAVVIASQVARRVAYAGLVLIAIAFLSYW
jgi:hypothetical protein